MATEKTTGCDPAPTAEPSPQTQVTDCRRRELEGRRVRAVWCAIFLAGVTRSGLFLHGLTPGGSAPNEVHSTVGTTILLVAHVILAVGFTVTMVRHLVDNRRRLLAFFKRRSARNLRCLLGYVAFVGASCRVDRYGDRQRRTGRRGAPHCYLACLRGRGHKARGAACDRA